jgi:ABC-2 type transport system ATP-binding protein
MKELVVRSLYKSYDNVSVLENVNLHYFSSTINGIIGSNGAGKSTLLNCIAGYIGYKGVIERKNIKTVGLLTASPYMFPRITGYEFIRFCLSAKNCKEDTVKLHKLNSLFELPLNRFADEYSTGMLKKLHLLALLLQDNDLLLLDEPFNGLDALSSAYLSELLLGLKQQGAFIFISSHNISQLIKISNTLTLVENCNVTMKSESLSDIEKRTEEEAKSKVQEIFNTVEIDFN